VRFALLMLLCGCASGFCATLRADEVEALHRLIAPQADDSALPHNGKVTVCFDDGGVRIEASR